MVVESKLIKNEWNHHKFYTSVTYIHPVTNLCEISGGICTPNINMQFSVTVQLNFNLTLACAELAVFNRYSHAICRFLLSNKILHAILARARVRIIASIHFTCVLHELTTHSTSSEYSRGLLASNCSRVHHTLHKFKNEMYFLGSNHCTTVCTSALCTLRGYNSESIIHITCSVLEITRSNYGFPLCALE